MTLPIDHAQETFALIVDDRLEALAVVLDRRFEAFALCMDCDLQAVASRIEPVDVVLGGELIPSHRGHGLHHGIRQIGVKEFGKPAVKPEADGFVSGHGGCSSVCGASRGRWSDATTRV